VNTGGFVVGGFGVVVVGMAFSQRFPVNPAVQTQEKSFTPSTQLPLF